MTDVLQSTSPQLCKKEVSSYLTDLFLRISSCTYMALIKTGTSNLSGNISFEQKHPRQLLSSQMKENIQSKNENM